MRFLSEINIPIKYRTAVYPQNRNKDESYKVIDAMLVVYNNSGFTIGIIYIDIEFKTLMDKMKYELDIKLNYTNVDDHVSEAERKNHTIKGRV